MARGKNTTRTHRFLSPAFVLLPPIPFPSMAAFWSDRDYILSFLFLLYRPLYVFFSCRWWWARQGAVAPRRRAVHSRRRRDRRRRPGAAPARGGKEGGGARGHGRNAQAPGGPVRALGGPREVLALRRLVTLSSSSSSSHSLLSSFSGALFLSMETGDSARVASCHSFRIVLGSCVGVYSLISSSSLLLVHGHGRFSLAASCHSFRIVRLVCLNLNERSKVKVQAVGQKQCPAFPCLYKNYIWAEFILSATHTTTNKKCLSPEYKRGIQILFSLAVSLLLQRFV